MVIKQKNGYTLGVNKSGVLYLAFRGETEANPHMYLGKDNDKNRKDALRMFEKYANIKDSLPALDKAIRNMDAYSYKSAYQDLERAYRMHKNNKPLLKDMIKQWADRHPEKEARQALKDFEKQHGRMTDKAIKNMDAYNKFSNEKNVEFLKNAIAEMRRYERNWNFMSVKEKREIMPNGGLSALRADIKNAENRLKELGK